MTRRTFLSHSATLAVLAGASALPYGFARLLAPAQARADRNYLRPPGAIENDAQFIAACIGCGLCGEICPPKCIRFHSRDGGAAVNTPYIDPTQKACILCNRCMIVCPTEALTPIETHAINMGIALIDRSACYPWVDRGICGACVSVCPRGGAAIGYKMWGQYRPFIKAGCVGCGLCVEVCPHPSKPIWIKDKPRSASARKEV